MRSRHPIKKPAPLSTLLPKLRASAALTQFELATRAGVSLQTVSAVEQGRSGRPTIRTLRKLAKGLGVDAAVLLRARPERFESHS